MIFGFRKNNSPKWPQAINGTEVEQVSLFEFFGTHIADDLLFFRSFLYFLCKLMLFGVNQLIVIKFYRGLSKVFQLRPPQCAPDKQASNKLSSVVRAAQRRIGTSLRSFQAIFT